VRSFSSICVTRTSVLSSGNNARRPQPLSQSTLPKATTTTTTKTSLGLRHSSSWLLSALPNIIGSGAGGPNKSPSPETTLHASRTLPYPPSHVYSLIADVGSYRSFLPHCSSSRVTAWTKTADPATGKRYPARADLTVGWGPFTESYTSRVYCVPGEVVEAISGNAHTSIPAETLARAGYGPEQAGTEPMTGGLFESLVTRWTVRPVAAQAAGGNAATGGEGEGWTEVELSVRFQFANPMLGQIGGQLANAKVDEMVQAFEDRARKTYRR